MDLATYTSDHLIKLTGASDPVSVDFVLASARTAKSSGSLFDKLSGILDGDEAELRRFSDDLYSRAKPSSNGTSAQRKEKPKEAKKRYALVDMGAEEEETQAATVVKASNGDREKKSKQIDDKIRIELVTLNASERFR